MSFSEQKTDNSSSHEEAFTSAPPPIELIDTHPTPTGLEKPLSSFFGIDKPEHTQEEIDKLARASIKDPAVKAKGQDPSVVAEITGFLERANDGPTQTGQRQGSPNPIRTLRTALSNNRGR
jgi:hypothetical protein